MADIIPQAVLNKVRRDKFVFVVDTPKVLKDWETKDARTKNLLNRDKMQFSVIGVNMPSHNIPPVGLAYMGQTMHVTSQARQEYPPVKIQFTIDNNFDNYWFVWKWMYILNHPKNSGMDKYFAEFQTLENQVVDATRNKGYNELKKTNLPPVTYKKLKMVHDYTDYQTTMTLYGLREYNEKIVKFDYSNAFPIGLGEINYDYRETDEISCYLEFSYGQIDVSLIDPV